MDIVSTTLSINSDDKKVRYNGLLYFAENFISNHVTIHNRYSLLSLPKT